MGFLFWALLAVNAFGFLAMGADKVFAMRRQWRVPEAQLIAIAAFGGLIGVWLGVFVLRHKSYKRSFQQKLVLASTLNLLWLWLYLRS